jgi:hypothetical protein
VPIMSQLTSWIGFFSTGSTYSLVVMRLKKIPGPRSYLWIIRKVLSQPFPFENIALEIKDKCKIISMQSCALNQNHQARTKLFLGSTSRLLFGQVDKATRSWSLFINNSIHFHLIFVINYSMVVSRRKRERSARIPIKSDSRLAAKGHLSMSSFFLLCALISR